MVAGIANETLASDGSGDEAMAKSSLITLADSNSGYSRGLM